MYNLQSIAVSSPRGRGATALARGQQQHHLINVRTTVATAKAPKLVCVHFTVRCDHLYYRSPKYTCSIRIYRKRDLNIFSTATAALYY